MTTQECIICFEDKKVVSFQGRLCPCQHYHQICKKCRGKMKKQCPVCRESWTFHFPSMTESLEANASFPENIFNERSMVDEAKRCWRRGDVTGTRQYMENVYRTRYEYLHAKTFVEAKSKLTRWVIDYDLTLAISNEEIFEMTKKIVFLNKNVWTDDMFMDMFLKK